MAARPRGITLTPEFQAHFTPGISQSFRIRIVASEAVGLPREVFAYRAIPLQPGAAAPRGIFSHVCSPCDIDDFPEGAPYPDAVPPWFRLDWLDLACRTRAQAMEVYAKVVADVRALVRALDDADVLVAQAPLRIGGAVPDGIEDGSSYGSSDGSLNE